MAQKKESLDELYQALNVHNQYAMERAITEDILLDLDRIIEQAIFKKKYYDLKKSALDRYINLMGDGNHDQMEFWRSMVTQMGSLMPYKAYSKEQIEDMKLRVAHDHKALSFRYHIERLEQANNMSSK
jgi:hypothetical protein